MDVDTTETPLEEYRGWEEEGVAPPSTVVVVVVRDYVAGVVDRRCEGGGKDEGAQFARRALHYRALA